MKNKGFKFSVPVFTMVAILIAAVGFTFFSISSSLDDLSTEINPDPTEALLASTELSVDSTTYVPVAYYSQVADSCVNLYDLSSKSALKNRQFEWAECGYYSSAFEQGLVKSTLDSSRLPQASNSGGTLLANRGVTSANFSRWFNAVDGLSTQLPSVISLNYSSASGTFSFKSSDFHPISSDLFTMDFAVSFTALLSGNESFNISADDDTWVFLNDQLVLDMGGIHGAMQGVLNIDEYGNISASVDGAPAAQSDITLSKNQTAELRIFHANRNNSESIYEVNFANMYLNIFNTAIAYNEDGSSYIPPLGETTVFEADHSGSILTSIIAQFFILGILLILLIAVAGLAFRRRQIN